MYLIATGSKNSEDERFIGWYASVIHNNIVTGISESKKLATNFQIETDEMNGIIEASKNGKYQVEEYKEGKKG